MLQEVLLKEAVKKIFDGWKKKIKEMRHEKEALKGDLVETIGNEIYNAIGKCFFDMPEPKEIALLRTVWNLFDTWKYRAEEMCKDSQAVNDQCIEWIEKEVDDAIKAYFIAEPDGTGK